LQSREVNGREFRLGSVLTITLGHAANDVYASFLPSLLPLFIANFGLTKTQAGLLTLIRQTPSLLQPAIGHLADRLRLRGIIILAPTVTAIMMSLLGKAPSYIMLALLLVVGGSSSAAFHAVAPAMAGDLSGSKNMGRGMGLWIFGGELGLTLGPLLVASVVTRFGLKSTPWLMFIGMLGSLLLFFRLKNIPHKPVQPTQGLPWRQALTQMRHSMLPLLALVVVRSFTLSALGSYLPTFLIESGSSFWLAGASLTVYQAAGSGGVLVGGALSDRLGRRAVMVASMLLTPLLLFVFLRLHGAAQVMTLLGIGSVVVTFDPVAMAVVQENSAQNRALASSVYLSLTFLIRSLATVAVGALADWFGLYQAFAASAAIFLLGTPLLFLLPAKRGSMQ